MTEPPQTSPQDIDESIDAGMKVTDEYMDPEDSSSRDSMPSDPYFIIPIKPNKSPKRSKRTYEESPNEEIMAAIDLLKRGVPPEDFDLTTLRTCIHYINEFKIEASKDKNYLKANEWSDLSKSVSKAADVADFSGQCTITMTDLIQKQADANKIIDDLNATWMSRFTDFENMISDKRNELSAQHSKEIKDFDDSIPSELPPKFLKHSTEYILMRKKEGLLAHNQQYLAANELKKKADALEEAELAEMRHRLQEDLQRRRDQLIATQNAQFESFLQWVNSQRHDMLRSRDKDMEGPLKRLEYYEKVVRRLEKKGIPPNPFFGHTTNRVSRRESIRAVRNVTFAQSENSGKDYHEEILFQYRPSSSMSRSQGRSVLRSSTLHSQCGARKKYL